MNIPGQEPEFKEPLHNMRIPVLTRSSYASMSFEFATLCVEPEMGKQLPHLGFPSTQHVQKAWMQLAHTCPLNMLVCAGPEWEPNPPDLRYPTHWDI